MPTYAALIYDTAENEKREPSPEEWAAVMAEYNAFGEEAGAAGVIAGGEALQPTSTATTIKVTGGKGGDVVTTDGPFAETKEVLGGFYLLNCGDLDEALKWAAQIPGAWHGRVEVRPCIDFAQESTS
ncbi:MAG TPA: YciI family protein [Acidimicrobiales bacterium]